MRPHTHISQDSDSERPSKVASTSRKYSIYTHFPKDRNCEVCLRSKITRAPCRRRAGEAVLRAEMFGDLMTADHKALREGCESRNNHWYAVVVHATGNCKRYGIPECLEDFTESLKIAEVLTPAGISHDSDPERPRKVASRKHSIITHFPKDPNCEVCKRNKITRTPCRRLNWEFAEKFGGFDEVRNEGCESRHNHRYSIVVQDVATQSIQSYPCKTKTSQET